MFLKIRSKNQSCAPLRRCIETKTPTVLRLGSTTPLDQIFSPKLLPKAKEINTIEGCIISGNKTKMKEAFDKAEVKTARWMNMSQGQHDYVDELEFPAIIKHNHSSKGNGIYYIENEEDLEEFVNEHKNNINEYIIEEYKKYVREYRLHVTEDGCFYTCRKMLREDAEVRWHRHENNSVWIMEENELFDKPSNWDDIVNECIKAMKACKLQICAIDVKVQSSKKANPEFIILETNSAPALGAIGIEKYKEQLKKMI